MPKCKICGAPIIVSAPALGLFNAQPTCECGKIRMAERLKGCPICGAQDSRVQMTKQKDTYTLTCTCGAKWERLP